MWFGYPDDVVFSAHAEVVPLWPVFLFYPMRILRARGGSSITDHRKRGKQEYSPRTRR